MIFLFLGPISRQSSPGLDDLPEDDDVEVDVEECSDSESVSPSKRSSIVGQPTTPGGTTDDCGSDRDSPASPTVQGKMTSKCNCEELMNTDCHLETKDLWDKFHDLGTEMIITKTGR